MVAVRSIPVPARYDRLTRVIELDSEYLEQEGVLEGLALLVHELAHWVMDVCGIKEYHHHGPEWRKTLTDVGLDPDVLRYALEGEDDVA